MVNPVCSSPVDVVHDSKLAAAVVLVAVWHRGGRVLLACSSGYKGLQNFKLQPSNHESAYSLSGSSHSHIKVPLSRHLSHRYGSSCRKWKWQDCPSCYMAFIISEEKKNGGVLPSGIMLKVGCYNDIATERCDFSVAGKLV
ncbi:PREDICTED: uncharacterized protein LOC104596091 isoform X2 [Nelumbo nucifera]|uniref:Uncharacterized protein LOC104596091 isoform X2 n=1 Tax=Nelumbo nucifera TaxID=4432 RepID=A0A1U8Q2Q6_NELNU|nr:PREDICTED: uncharacterized protein LOC104596091 isoform X2 [Nelumbo nucifera]